MTSVRQFSRKAKGSSQSQAEEGVQAPPGGPPGGVPPPGEPPDDDTMPPDEVNPVIKLPPVALAQIVATGEAVCSGAITAEQGEKEVAQQHRDTATAAIADKAQKPAGSLKAKQVQLVETKIKIKKIEKILKTTTKSEEVIVQTQEKRPLVEKVMLWLVTTMVVLFAVFSIYANKTFLESFGIFSGAAAWGMSFVPFLATWLVKWHIGDLDDSHQRIAQHTYVFISVVCAAVWMLSFGAEAGSAATVGLGEVNQAGAAESNALRMQVRGFCQLALEALGGAVLFHWCYTWWSRRGPGQAVKEYRLRDKWVKETQNLKKLRELEAKLEHQIALIEKWFESHTYIIDAYVAKACADLRSAITSLGTGMTA